MDRQRLCGVACATFAALLFASQAYAHAVLDRTQARFNSAYRGAVTITHGCQGSPTTAVRVTIPEGVVAVKPMPKPGWTLAMTKGPYERSYSAFHGALSSGVKEIAWTGGPLPNDQFDEFVFSGFVSDAFAPGAIIRFPVVQECADGVSRWVDSPAEGQSAHDLKFPAPGVLVLAAEDTKAAPVAPLMAGTLRIETPTIRATPAGAKVAAGYLRITNTGTTPDKLLGGSVPFAGRMDVHEMSVTDGVMKMRPLADGLEIAPGQSIELKPGGFHLMFQDLRNGVKEGEAIAGTLRFEKAGDVAVVFAVGGLGASSSAPAHAH